MALIKCPECGGNISDKAPACIHCGFPLDKIEISNIDIAAFDVVYMGFSNNDNDFGKSRVSEKLFEICGFQRSASQYFIDNPPRIIMSGLSKENAEWVKWYFKGYGATIEINESKTDLNENNNQKISMMVTECKNRQSQYRKNQEQAQKQRSTIMCPRCGSAAITTGQRGYNLLLGFIGSGQTVNRCANCGHKWYPR